MTNETDDSGRLRTLYAEHDGYVSDKWSSYIDVYDRFLSVYKKSPINMLEIGLQNGGSLQIWSKYFVNAKKIIGCDINPACAELAFSDLRISVVVGDVNRHSVRGDILKHADSFNLIIDDGSHFSSDIVNTFKYFYPLLAPGGVYVVEDLHCSYWSRWQGGLWRNGSAIEFFKNLADVVNFESWGVTLPVNKMISRFKGNRNGRFNVSNFLDVDSVSFHNSLCIITKGHSRNSIGTRLVVGKVALVEQNLPPSGSAMSAPVQKKNNSKLNL